MKRPFAVTLLSIIAVIAGIVAIFDALRFFGILPMFSLGPIGFYGSSFIGAIFAIIAAGIWFWVASKLWNLDPQGWLFVVVIAIVYLVFDVMAIFGGSSFQAMLPSIALNGLALILGLLPGTKRAFGQS